MVCTVIQKGLHAIDMRTRSCFEKGRETLLVGQIHEPGTLACLVALRHGFAEQLHTLRVAPSSSECHGGAA